MSWVKALPSKKKMIRSVCLPELNCSCTRGFGLWYTRVCTCIRRVYIHILLRAYQTTNYTGLPGVPRLAPYYNNILFVTLKLSRAYDNNWIYFEKQIGSDRAESTTAIHASTSKHVFYVIVVHECGQNAFRTTRPGVKTRKRQHFTQCVLRY